MIAHENQTSEIAGAAAWGATAAIGAWSARRHVARGDHAADRGHDVLQLAALTPRWSAAACLHL
eukprot:scaffold101119_cov31-Tisochrysis_lutea.AAC.4